MPKLGHYAIKTLRYTAWPLMMLMICYIITGFAMSGRFGFNHLMDKRLAVALHRWLHVPLLILLPLHAVCAIYFAMRRRRWIRR